MGFGFLIGLGAAAGIFVIDHRLYHRKFMKKLEKEKQDYLNRIELNKTHLPSKELPELSPDRSVIEEFIKRTRFDFTDEGESYSYICRDENYCFERRNVFKSELDDDTVKLIELIKHDVDWFYGHPTGNSAGECGSVLESFLREKYPMLTEKSVSRIVGTYCINDR